MRTNHNQRWGIMTCMNSTHAQERELHIAFRMYVSCGFSKELLSDRQMKLLEVYYGV